MSTPTTPLQEEAFRRLRRLDGDNMDMRENKDWLADAGSDIRALPLPEPPGDVREAMFKVIVENCTTDSMTASETVDALLAAGFGPTGAAEARIAELEMELAIMREDLARIKADNGQFGVGA